MASLLPVPVQTLLDLAKQAGVAILAIYNSGFSVTEKTDHTPLTEADLAAHRVIVTALKELTPEIPVLSEESQAIPFETRKKWSRYWLVDPLDGTKEFIKHNGEFGVNIALIEEQQPVAGVIYAPILDIAYYCTGDGKAWRIRQQLPPENIHVTRQRRHPPIIAGSRSHAGPQLQAFLQRIGGHKLIPMGSSLKSCLVAEGKADLYARLGPTSEWDTAAAQAIVEAAGGRITDTQMRPLLYNTKPSLLNPHFFVFGDLSEDWSAYL
ncbi:MAG: 3'(2'),5'-bisphosphate nucleotidase CysQ [Chromatiales bacterium]|nr:3'(2'),5'-bisphosphate nucleotidase CysQ [Gammaproteobacteria bacterium]